MQCNHSLLVEMIIIKIVVHDVNMTSGCCCYLKLIKMVIVFEQIRERDESPQGHAFKFEIKS